MVNWLAYPIQLHPVVVAPPVAAPIDLVPLGSIFEARMLRQRPKMVDFHPCPRLQEAHWKRGYYPSRRAVVERETERPTRRAVVEREAERPTRQAVEQREAERPMRRAAVEQREAERPMRRAAVEQREAERSMRRAAVEQREAERPTRRAAVVPNCRLAPLAVPDAANLAYLQNYWLLPLSFFRYCGKGKELLSGSLLPVPNLPQ
jgi:hypothetical protein